MELSEIRTEMADSPKNSPQTDASQEPDKVKAIPEKGWITKSEEKFLNFFKTNRKPLKILLLVILFHGYITYFGFALAYRVGDAGSWRLIGFTIFGILLAGWFLLQKIKRGKQFTDTAKRRISEFYYEGRKSTIIRCSLYIGMALFMVIYLIVAVAIKTPQNLRSLIGIFGFPFLLFLFSNNKSKVNWHTVFWGMSIQYAMALLILKTNWGFSVIDWIGDRLAEFVANTDPASRLIFGPNFMDHRFIFQSLPNVMLLTTAISVLTYLGVINFIVDTLGQAMAFILQTKPVEGVFMIGSIFLNVPECAILVLDFLPTMTESELFVVLAGALSTVGGTSIIIFSSFGIPLAPLIAASALSAPAALAACKIVYPSTEDEEVPVHEPQETTEEARKLLRKPKSIMDAVIFGIIQGTSIVVTVVAFFIVFLAIIEFLNSTLVWFGDRIGVEGMTLKFLFSYVFYPFAFMMGARQEDCLQIGDLLGIRTFTLPFAAYPGLGNLVRNGAVFRHYTMNPNNTWTHVGNNIYLNATDQTLIGGVVEPRSEAIAIYSLCGSASLVVAGYFLGTLVLLLPSRTSEIKKGMLKAVIVGTVACYLTACFAGLLYEENSRSS